MFMPGARTWAATVVLALALPPLAATAAVATQDQAPRIVSTEFIAPAPPTPSAHASTIAETGDGLVAAWFGGTREGAADVGIWLSRQDRSGAWAAPVEVAITGKCLR
ncbi:MAG: exo-alpha-sialidase [Vicinamibacterales bacterium]